MSNDVISSEKLILLRLTEDITVHATKACGESDRKAPLSLKLSPRWMWVLSYTIRPL
jgi:hypothetical protein